MVAHPKIEPINSQSKACCPDASSANRQFSQTRLGHIAEKGERQMNAVRPGGPTAKSGSGVACNLAQLIRKSRRWPEGKENPRRSRLECILLATFSRRFRNRVNLTTLSQCCCPVEIIRLSAFVAQLFAAVTLQQAWGSLSSSIVPKDYGYRMRTNRPWSGL